MQDGKWKEENHEVGNDVEAGVAPENIHGVAVRCGSLAEVPKCVDGHADGAERQDNPEVRDDHDAQDDLGGQPDVVVGQDADVQAQNREFGEGEAEGVDDGREDARLRCFLTVARDGAAPSGDVSYLEISLYDHRFEGEEVPSQAAMLDFW